MLLKKCICGESKGEKRNQNGIDVIQCAKCSVVRQDVKMTEAEYDNFYKKDYHVTHQKDIGREDYLARYNKDRELAKKRLQLYIARRNLSGKSVILDIGAGNGAFVDECVEQGFNESYAVDLSVSCMRETKSFLGKFPSLNFPSGSADLITLHDTFEHLVDPCAYLKEIRRVLKPDGLLVLDLPDFWVAEGNHHWRPIQHLWYFNAQQMKKLFEETCLNIIHFDKPIPSKAVYYCQRNIQKESTPKRILIWPGIGDIAWVMTKMQAFIEQELNGVIPVVKIWNFDNRPRSEDYVKRIPFIQYGGYFNSDIKDKVTFNQQYHFGGRAIVPDHLGFDYVISYNGDLRIGKSLEETDPQYAVNWNYPLFETFKEREAKKFYGETLGDFLVGYFSDTGMFKTWLRHMPIPKLVTFLKELSEKTGKKIVLTGCEWDRPMNDLLAHLLPKDRFINMVGMTSLDDLFGLIKASKGVVGYCSGNTISATMFKKPTIILWSKSYFPRTNFHKYSCPPNDNYLPLTVEEFKQSRVIEQAKQLYI